MHGRTRSTWSNSLFEDNANSVWFRLTLDKQNEFALELLKLGSELGDKLVTALAALINSEIGHN
jgi:hypothetical protein